MANGEFIVTAEISAEGRVGDSSATEAALKAIGQRAYGDQRGG